MDRVYKADVPASRKALEQLREDFADLRSKTDWNKLRIEPLLAHASSLEQLLRSRQFVRETARLPRGVAMFHSDLVYLRENIKALKTILESERKRHTKTPGASSRQSASRAPKRGEA